MNTKNFKDNKKLKYIIAAVVLLLLAIGFSLYLFILPAPHYEEEAYLYIDNDDTLDSLTAKVREHENAVQASGFATLARHFFSDDNLHRGRYAIISGMSNLTLIRNIRNRNQAAINLTIPSVRTLDKLAAYLGNTLMADSADFAKLFNSNEACSNYSCVDIPLSNITIQALFIPNTYEVYWDITPENLLKRMEKENNIFWNIARKQKAQQQGLTPVEVYTLASIIDEETANNKEKPMIAGMYLNRLHINMPLQADPTVKYALKNFALKRILHDDLKIDSPYNTYVNTGLPPGPIRIAGIAGIDAVLDAVHHDYLYMCAKEDFSGTHNFAVTYKEHLQNAARYTQELNRRNIMR
jgi:UPF0755 protein